MYNLVDLSGKKIIIAGASSGIGCQTAITLSRLGAELILIARRETELKKNLLQLDGEGHSFYSIDLSRLENIEPFVKTIVSEKGKIDGLVYSAGVSWELPLRVDSAEKMRDVFNINYFGFVEMVKCISKKGRFNAGMRIVAVSSTAAFCGDAALTTYSATKAAMDGAVRCMAKELSKKEICVNTIAPAMTETIMYDNYINEVGENSESEHELLKRQYLGIGKPQDMANAIAFLISPAARFITGICLPVDGGYTSC